MILGQLRYSHGIHRRFTFLQRALVSAGLCALLAISASGERAQQSDSFVNSIGVNTHIAYTNTPYYQQWPSVMQALQNLHVRHVRDGYYPWPSNNVLYQRHHQLSSLGIDCDYVVSFGATADQLATFKSLAGDVGYWEAPNEMDDHKGSDWVTRLQTFMPTLYLSGQATQVPVLGPSLVYRQSYTTLGEVGAWMTYNNLHIYFGGRNPGIGGWGSTDPQGHSYGSIAWWQDNADTDAPGVPAVVTESGYISEQYPKPYEISGAIEARYVPRTVLEMFNAGIVRTYFYQLIDDGLSAYQYGLMDKSLRPKAGYTALSNLTGILSDPGPSFQPGVLNYTLTGNVTNVHHLLLQKRDGSYYLAAWIEVSGYNPATNAALSVPAQSVTLTLPETHTIGLQRFNDSGQVVSTSLGTAQTVTLKLTDSVSILRIGPA